MRETLHQVNYRSTGALLTRVVSSMGADAAISMFDDIIKTLSDKLSSLNFISGPQADAIATHWGSVGNYIRDMQTKIAPFLDNTSPIYKLVISKVFNP